MHIISEYVPRVTLLLLLNTLLFGSHAMILTFRWEILGLGCPSREMQQDCANCY